MYQLLGRMYLIYVTKFYYVVILIFIVSHRTQSPFVSSFLGITIMLICSLHRSTITLHSHYLANIHQHNTAFKIDGRQIKCSQRKYVQLFYNLFKKEQLFNDLSLGQQNDPWVKFGPESAFVHPMTKLLTELI